MKLKNTLLALGLASTSLLTANPWWEAAQLELDMQTGYRQDAFKWSIAGSDRYPNILSELQWKDLRMWEIGAIGKLTTREGIYVRAKADYGRILSGRNQDSDYAGNNRTKEFSRSTADASKGYVYDLSVGAGRRYCLLQEALSLYPMFGLSFHEQHLRMYKGNLKVGYKDEPLGRFSGLNSTYTAQWAGPWIGFDAAYQANCELTLLGTFEYHWARYNGRGHWNLRRDFIDDFRQRAYGHGIVSSIGALYDLGCNWSFGIDLGYQIWRTGSGRDTTKVREEFDLPDGSYITIPVTYHTHFNKAHWHSFSALATVAYTY